jgi:lipoate-protein ligase A
MKYLDLTLPTPAENLACDEALLNMCEEGAYADEILRVWEAGEYFVVVGYANQVAAEVNLTACRARGIPVFRRCSGGGTVLQGPGCLNYALILKITQAGPLRSISAANRSILERNRDTIETLLDRRNRCGEAASLKSEVQSPKSAIEVCGHTDLVVGGRKFSGNSQRRKRRFLLFHGTFLLNFDMALVEALLRLPSKSPAYRRNRTHAQFLTNLSVPADQVKAALRRSWNSAATLTKVPKERICSLVAQKYSAESWNLKF